MSDNNKNNLLVQGSILAIAGILVRIIGLIYRIPMANMLGAEGNGIYSVAFSIYNIALTLSSYSLPLALSKLISEKYRNHEYKRMNQIFQSALVLAATVGIIACITLFFGADYLEKLYAKDGLSRPLRILAITTLIMAFVGVLRGFFQGKQTMIPTAISQIIEQIVNAIVSVLATYAFIHSHKASKDLASYGAAGGTLGTLVGALSALLFLLFMYCLSRPAYVKDIKNDSDKSRADNGIIYKILLLTIIPIILSQTVYQLGSTLDDLLFGNLMKQNGLKEGVISSLQGVYNSQYSLLINVPIAIASAMAAATVPNIVLGKMKDNQEDINNRVETIIKFIMVIAFPCFIGLTVLGKPIILLLFPNLTTYSDLASNLLFVGSSAIVFYTLSTITSAVLQGNDHMRLPVIHSSISLVIHVALVFILLTHTDLGVYALVIGNITFPLVICILNGKALHKKMSYQQEVKKTFLFPLLCSAIMGVITYFDYHVFDKLMNSNIIAILLSVIGAVIIYFISILYCKCFSIEEYELLPIGNLLLKCSNLLYRLKRKLRRLKWKLSNL